MNFAAELGITTGRRRAGAAQAGGAALPIYDVGPLQLAVDGRPTVEEFCAAPITPYDVILGESWLLKHGGILDYERCQLGRRGVLDGEFHLLDPSSPPIGDLATGEGRCHAVADAVGPTAQAHLAPVMLGVRLEPTAAEVEQAFQEPALVPDFASTAVITPGMMAACDRMSCHVDSLVGAGAYRAQRRCQQRRHEALLYGAGLCQGAA